MVSGDGGLGDRDFRGQVDVLNGVQEFGTFFDGALESLTARDEPVATGPLVDDRSLHRFGEVVIARGTARIDQADAAHVAISHLVAGEVDGVVRSEVGVHTLVDLAVRRLGLLNGEVATIVLGQLLLDDVGTDRDAEVVGLASEVSGYVVVLILLESVIAGIAPEDGGHAEFVSLLEGGGDFDDLAIRFGRAKVDGRTDRGAAHVGGLLERAVHHLVTDVWVGEQLVVVYLHHERNLVGVAAGDAAEHAEGRTNRVATAFDGELHDIFTVEVNRVLGERSTSGVLNALVDREDGHVTRICEATRAVQTLEVSEDAVIAVGRHESVFDPIGAGQVNLLLLDLRVAEPQEGLCICTEKFLDFAVVAHGARKGGSVFTNEPPQKGRSRDGLQARIHNPP